VFLHMNTLPCRLLHVGPLRWRLRNFKNDTLFWQGITASGVASTIQQQLKLFSDLNLSNLALFITKLNILSLPINPHL